MMVDTSKIKAKVAELKAKLEALPTFTDDEITASKPTWLDLIEQLNNEANWTAAERENWKAAYEKVNPIFEAKNAVDEIKRLEKTLASDLMKVTTRYLVTDAKELVNPAGFTPDDKVYLQTRIAIHTDSLKDLPSSNRQLRAFEIN